MILILILTLVSLALCSLRAATNNDKRLKSYDRRGSRSKLNYITQRATPRRFSALFSNTTTRKLASVVLSITVTHA